MISYLVYLIVLGYGASNEHSTHRVWDGIICKCLAC